MAIYSTQWRSWTRDYREQIQIAVGWRRQGHPDFKASVLDHSATPPPQIIRVYYDVILTLNTGTMIGLFLGYENSPYSKTKQAKQTQRTNKNNGWATTRSTHNDLNSCYRKIYIKVWASWKVQPKFFKFVICNPCQSSPSWNALIPLCFTTIISLVLFYL